LVDQQTKLITRLELIIQKNTDIITKLKDNTVKPEEAEKEYTSHVDELELIKPEITLTKDSYCKMVINSKNTQ